MFMLRAVAQLEFVPARGFVCLLLALYSDCECFIGHFICLHRRGERRPTNTKLTAKPGPKRAGLGKARPYECNTTAKHPGPTSPLCTFARAAEFARCLPARNLT